MTQVVIPTAPTRREDPGHLAQHTGHRPRAADPLRPARPLGEASSQEELRERMAGYRAMGPETLEGSRGREGVGAPSWKDADEASG